MTNLTIEKYFADNYNKWLRRANTLCYSYYISRDNAADILHDAIRVVCEKYSEQGLLDLLSTQISNDDTLYTLLDLYISRTISNKLMNFGGRVKRLRSKKVDIDINLLNVAGNEYTPRYDVYERQQYLRKVISEMNTDDWTKRILTWRLIETIPVNKIRGIDNHKILGLYHTGLQQLQANL